MQPAVYEHFAQIEEKHWWFTSRIKLIDSIVEKLNFPNKKGLDVGCGTGGTLNFHLKYGTQNVGLDYSELAIQLAKGKKPKEVFIHGDANYLEDYFKPEEFSLVTCLNVLYHDWINDESEVVRSISRILMRDGIFVLTDPAFNFLIRDHDKQVMGSKRYRLNFYKTMLEKNGFNVEYASYFNIISFFPAFLVALIFKIKKCLNLFKVKENEVVHEIGLPHIFINNFLELIMAFERFFLSRGLYFPVGVSLICIARKK